jgi:hypothetical protein
VAPKDKKPPATPNDPRAREEELFFREVSEELKQDRYARLWKKYGRHFVTLAVVCVLGVAGHQYWQSEQRRGREAASETFAAALAEARAGKLKEAAQAFGALAQQQGADGYGAFARFQQAAALAKSGDKAGAVSIYDGLAGDAKIDPLFRDLAVVYWAYFGLDDADPAKAIDRLKPVTADANAWRHLARELTALYHERAGRRKEALELLDKLAKDAQAPAGVRARAVELSAILGKS